MNVSRTFILCVFISLASYAMAEDSAKDKKRNDFINGLELKCAYTDGYQCHQSDPSFYSQQAQESLVPAVYIPAWNAAYDAFQALKDLTDAQKELTHYKIGFAEEGNHIVVLFSAIFLPYFDEDKPEGISTGVFGQSTKFWVDKETMEVSKWLYLK